MTELLHHANDKDTDRSPIHLIGDGPNIGGWLSVSKVISHGALHINRPDR